MENYSLYWWDGAGNQHEEMRYIPETELETKIAPAVERLIRGPISKIGGVRRVIITDSGDSTLFDWRHGEGVVWPNPENKWPKDWVNV